VCPRNFTPSNGPGKGLERGNDMTPRMCQCTIAISKWSLSYFSWVFPLQMSWKRTWVPSKSRMKLRKKATARGNGKQIQQVTHAIPGPTPQHSSTRLHPPYTEPATPQHSSPHTHHTHHTPNRVRNHGTQAPQPDGDSRRPNRGPACLPLHEHNACLPPSTPPYLAPPSSPHCCGSHHRHDRRCDKRHFACKYRDCRGWPHGPLYRPRARPSRLSEYHCI